MLVRLSAATLNTQTSRAARVHTAADTCRAIALDCTVYTRRQRYTSVAVTAPIDEHGRKQIDAWSDTSWQKVLTAESRFSIDKVQREQHSAFVYTLAIGLPYVNVSVAGTQYAICHTNRGCTYKKGTFRRRFTVVNPAPSP